MKEGLLPKTKLGVWSVCLLVAVPILFVVAPVLGNLLHPGVAAGNTIAEDIANRPALALTMLVGIVSGVSAFVSGLVALIRFKERGFLVIASTLLGGILTAFMIGELLLDH